MHQRREPMCPPNPACDLHPVPSLLLSMGGLNVISPPNPHLPFYPYPHILIPHIPPKAWSYIGFKFGMRLKK
ncbi:hypothetical protein XENTR_v10020249 [Xenopus tropicalis]|nr:hypothetical protein XENTR_v10020249 [Xenopus tropicalis]